MLDRHAKRKTEISERELQAIAKAMYEERLAEVCTEQRSLPYNAEQYSTANLAFVDYFERLQKLGGHMSFLPDEERKLQEAGWGAQRIADLRSIITMREERDIGPIRPADMDRHLAAAGFAVDDKLRWMLELALCPAYRDAYAAVEQQLRSGLPMPALLPELADTSAPLPSRASFPHSHSLPVAASTAVPDEWLSCTPIEAAARHAGARRIVYTSHMGASATSAFPPMHDHATTEAMLAESGIAWTALRNGFYASTVPMLTGDAIASGVIEAAEDGPVSWTAHADLSAVAARIVQQEGRFDGPTPPLTASHALSLADVATILSEESGRNIERRTITDEEQAARLAAKGLPPKVVEISLGIYRAARAGEFAATNTLLAELIGREPISLRTVLAQRRGN